MKLDAVDQYSRRQNLEFQGVPVTADEDVIDKVIKLSELVGVKVTKNDISTAHRLRPKRHAIVNEPPPIIVRFINRNLRNQIYHNRISAKSLTETDFPISGMTKLYINENLTQERKRLLWQTKERAKSLQFSFVWTMNGRIYVRKNELFESLVIQSEADLSKLAL